MTDREAMLALAEPEPDYFDDRDSWQPWHDRWVAALEHARAEIALERAAACPWPR